MNAKRLLSAHLVPAIFLSFMMAFLFTGMALLLEGMEPRPSAIKLPLWVENFFLVLNHFLAFGLPGASIGLLVSLPLLREHTPKNKQRVSILVVLGFTILGIISIGAFYALGEWIAGRIGRFISVLLGVFVTARFLGVLVESTHRFLGVPLTYDAWGSASILDSMETNEAPPPPTVWPALKKNEMVKQRKAAALKEVNCVRRHGPQDPTEGGVECSVWAPPVVTASDIILVQVFLHTLLQQQRVADLASELDGDTRLRGIRTLEAVIEYGTELTFELALPELTVVDGVQSLVWRGKPEGVQFEVHVPSDCKPQTVIGIITVMEKTVPVGRIKFKLTVNKPAEAPVDRTGQLTGDDARWYTMAFISYASSDRPKVLARVQILQTLGIKYFQDILSLEPGDRWEKQLYRKIDECDLFLLFWSTAAKKSNWVRKETRYALTLQECSNARLPEIRPVLIEGPPVPAPWDELAHLHFNDKLLYVIAESSSTTLT